VESDPCRRVQRIVPIRGMLHVQALTLCAKEICYLFICTSWHYIYFSIDLGIELYIVSGTDFIYSEFIWMH
jgi:hypothetical protein